MKALLAVALPLCTACQSLQVEDCDLALPAGWGSASPALQPADGDVRAVPSATEFALADDLGFSSRWSRSSGEVSAIGLPATDSFAAPYRDDNWVGKSYTKLKLGTFTPSGDVSSFDDGFAGELVFGREVASLFGIEGSVGYLDGDGPGNTGYQVIPLFVQARLNIPILILEAYGGVGIGGVYADIAGSGPGTGSDFVGAGTAFLGVEVGLGNLALGLEGKHIVTQEINSAFEFEGTQVTLSLKLPF